MTIRKLLIVLPMLLLAGVVAIASPSNDFRTIGGTWMCPECAALKQADTPAGCEANGHKHALKLDDGRLIAFLDSPRAAELIHGGGRAMAKIQVCGLLDEKTQVIDVDAYRIDDVWSTWCGAHERMDHCRATGAGAPEGSGSSNK